MRIITYVPCLLCLPCLSCLLCLPYFLCTCLSCTYITLFTVKYFCFKKYLSVRTTLMHPYNIQPSLLLIQTRHHLASSKLRIRHCPVVTVAISCCCFNDGFDYHTEVPFLNKTLVVLMIYTGWRFKLR